MSAYDLVLIEKDGIPLLVSPGLEERGVAVVFTTRLGGMSEPPYDELNLAFHVGDDPSKVLENRERLSRAIGLNPRSVITAEQVHGCLVVEVDDKLKGKGAEGSTTPVAKADALLTKLPETSLLILTADCVPIALADPVGRTVAAVHAGWRGTVSEIAGRAVRAMTDMGSDPSDIIAFIGPAVGSCCYEVDAGLSSRFEARFGRTVVQEDQIVDLPESNAIILREAGVAENRIIRADRCTSCEPGIFFSYRAAAGRITGRQGVVAALLPS
ncbi:MAG: peptidoglycan editing factor PgeF [Candidatus Aquicultorales bacterium]